MTHVYSYQRKYVLSDGQVKTYTQNCKKPLIKQPYSRINDADKEILYVATEAFIPTCKIPPTGKQLHEHLLTINPAIKVHLAYTLLRRYKLAHQRNS